MNKYFLSLVVIIICLFGLFTSPVSVFADSRGYDEAEQIRRAGERLDEIDRNQKEQARQRYDARNGSSSSGSSSNGSDLVVALFMIVVIGVGVYYLINAIKKANENNLIQEREREIQLFKATALGFKIDDSSKICPACAETIKLKAAICKHCKKSFSKDEIQKAIDLALNSFLNKVMIKKQ